MTDGRDVLMIYQVKKLLDTPIPPAKPDPFQGPKSGAASRLCNCGDDIHCYPWQGSNFDVQGYAASYTVAKVPHPHYCA